MKTIILASSSPRRKEILKKTGIPFIVDPSNFEEDLNQNLNPSKLVKALSLGKAKDVAERHKDAIIIGADSIIEYKGQAIGKPYTRERAKKLITMLSGNIHFALTGYTITDTSSNRTVSKVVKTKIHMRKLTKKEIERYVGAGEALDRAGAYAIQDKGALFIDWIEGDFYNVMGLPLNSLVKSLKEFGVYVL